MVHSGGDKALLAALQMAKANYGNYLSVSGSDTFKANIVSLTAEHTLVFALMTRYLRKAERL